MFHYSQLSPLDSASLMLLFAYSMNSLFWGECVYHINAWPEYLPTVYLTTQGINPQNHAVKGELVSAYLSYCKICVLFCRTESKKWWRDVKLLVSVKNLVRLVPIFEPPACLLLSAVKHNRIPATRGLLINSRFCARTKQIWGVWPGRPIDSLAINKAHTHAI